MGPCGSGKQCPHEGSNKGWGEGAGPIELTHMEAVLCDRKSAARVSGTPICPAHWSMGSGASDACRWGEEGSGENAAEVACVVHGLWLLERGMKFWAM